MWRRKAVDPGWDVWPRYGVALPCCWVVAEVRGRAQDAGCSRWFLGLPRGKRRERGWDVLAALGLPGGKAAEGGVMNRDDKAGCGVRAGWLRCRG